MKHFRLAALAALALTSVMYADSLDQNTKITVNEPLMIPGKVLPPGNYVIKLGRSTSNRNIVEIFNDRQDKLQATLMAIPAFRTTPSNKTVLQYWETPSGNPRALRSWYFPGEQYGQEFAYPKTTAVKLAASNNNADVPTLNETESAGVADVLTERSTPLRLQAAERTQEPATAEEPTLLAQATPARNPEVAQNNPPPAANQTKSATPAELPQTASSLSLLTLMAFALIVAAALLHYVRRRDPAL